jgi:Spy/CpxP family protein refolding chaperone
MTYRWMMLVFAFVAPVPVMAQRPDGPPPPPHRREMLQKQIGERFMDGVAAQLKLDAPTRAKLQDHLLKSGEQRRDLAERSQMLRIQMVRAARDSTTSDAELRKFLAEASALKKSEDDIWKADQEALSRILTPRQHVQFVFMWLRLNDQIREVGNRGQHPRP